MKRKFIRSLWIIPLLVGLVMMIIGIVNLCEAGSMNVPSMWDPGWYSSSTSQMEKESLGIGLLIGGIFMATGVTLITLFALRTATMTEEEKSARLEKSMSHAKTMMSMLSDASIDLDLSGKLGELRNKVSGKEPDVYCDYCGSKLSSGTTECKACGAKLKKK